MKKEDILKLSELGENYDSYGTNAPSLDFINHIIKLLEKINVNFNNIQCFPCLDGIQIEYENNEIEIEVSLFPEQDCTYLITKNKCNIDDFEIIEHGAFNIKNTIEKLQEIKKKYF